MRYSRVVFDGWKLNSKLNGAAVQLERDLRGRGPAGQVFHLCPGTISETAAWALYSYACWQQTALSQEKKQVSETGALAGVRLFSWFLAMHTERFLTEWQGSRLDADTWQLTDGDLTTGPDPRPPRPDRDYMAIADYFFPLTAEQKVEITEDGYAPKAAQVFLVVMRHLTGTDHTAALDAERDDWNRIVYEASQREIDHANRYRLGDERCVRRSGFPSPLAPAGAH